MTTCFQVQISKHVIQIRSKHVIKLRTHNPCLETSSDLNEIPLGQKTPDIFFFNQKGPLAPVPNSEHYESLSLPPRCPGFNI